MTHSVFDAVQCWMMANVVSQMNWDIRLIFWEILPDIVPDLTTHLPALTEAVKKETDRGVLESLSFYPLPTTLSPETMNWRTGLATAWERQLKGVREKIARENNINEEMFWIGRYTHLLRGLTKVDGCGTVSEITCPSVLPTLVDEAHYVQKRLMALASTDSPPNLLGLLECLSALADWRPGPNVLTDPVTLNKWSEIWWELYQKEMVKLPYREDAVLLKGIAAKALLNLLETTRKEATKEETGIPAGTETGLLESLTTAVDVMGEIPGSYSRLRLLEWQPQDVTRFPIDSLAELPKTLLKRVKLVCQAPDKWLYSGEQNVLNIALQELFKWHQAGLLATCCLDLFPNIVPDVNNYVDEGLRRHFPIACLLNHRLCRLIVRKEVAALKEGRELLQRLEELWQWDCKLYDHHPTLRRIGWDGRIQLQQAGLATETPAAFQEAILETIKKEKSPEVRLILSLWKPEKGVPERVWRTWERWWQKALGSRKKNMSHTAALVLLIPDPSANIMTRRQKLKDVLWKLPKDARPKFSVAELTCLIGELSLGGGDMNNSRTWQFSPEETRFRIPTKCSAPAFSPGTIQTTGMDTPDETAGIGRRVCRT